MTFERNNLTKAQTMTVAEIEEQLPDLVEANDVVEIFQEMLRRKSKDDLDTWIDRAAASFVAHSRTVSSATGPPSKIR